ncbi:hypothetical protein [Hyphobacterium sp.]|uniref:hypothetical protein n=1 Tax=Hyphobacterium sp. TaxID=2004662 RepID=UPI00374A40E1
MSVATKRRRQVLTALGAGLFLLLSGLLVTTTQSTQTVLRSPPESLSPRLVAAPDTVAEISVVTADESFQLRRTLEGWALVSHDGYAADAELADRLITGIASLEPVGERTRTLSGYARLSLGAPESGGNATHIVMLDNNDRELANLLIGDSRADGHVYVRRYDEVTSWLTRGYLPDFADVTQWMQLDFLSQERSAIREACVLPEDGAGYCLLRPSLSSEAFNLVSPRGWELVSPGAGDGVATVLGRIRFRDVRPIAAMRGPHVAEHRISTVNGLEITLFIYETEGQYWARILAVAHSDSARQAAVALNERADGWAFALSDLTVDRLIRPLSGLAVQVSELPDN